MDKGWQVLKVDYNNSEDLRYGLTGVDTVISTISGQAELNLIDAAAHVHVRRFIPSEFEGPPSQRPACEMLDRGNRQSLARLQHYKTYGMDYAVFVCGIFYERFAPGGMAGLQIGHGTWISGEGEYLMNIREKRAYVPYNAGQHVYICMTSAQDVARFVVAALDLPHWPTEFRVCGDRVSARDVVRAAENMLRIAPPFPAYFVF
jgi:hypothetical protein